VACAGLEFPPPSQLMVAQRFLRLQPQQLTRGLVFLEQLRAKKHQPAKSGGDSYAAKLSLRNVAVDDDGHHSWVIEGTGAASYRDVSGIAETAPESSDS